MSEENIQDLVKKVFVLQEQRVHTYRVFDGHHQEYLKSAPNYDFLKYRQYVHDVTQEFNRISLAIIEIQTQLKNCDKKELVGLIKLLQDEEKSKLELTAALQLAKQNAIDHPHDEIGARDIPELKQRLAQTVEKINESLEEMKYELEGS
ncbi:required for excision 1-B domain-containing protein-like [Saccoglossus kowalevskii]|uniref:Uncharacterized protein C19orf60 homolog n=1 Tax=Saccoglossus kowalevskii TaxID=10224 RepID=A0ABM0GQ43_SACKO|nr:PREDICTED: uncharacterized protein C19orf60 homolog [Saccoglossus kowalevskii]